MTGKLIKGKGFRGALRYNLAKVEKNVAEVLHSTFARSGEHAIMKEVQWIRSLRPDLEKYFYHTSINFPPEENLSSAVMKAIGLDYLEASGFVNHQFIMFRHFDADHPHLHILVNRIDYEGNVKSDSNDFQQAEKILRQLEVKYSLRQVKSSRETKERPVTKDELEMMKRTNQPSDKLRLQVIIGSVLKTRPTTAQFIQRLEHKGVSVLFNQASTGRISGISYQLGDFKIKGTKLGNDFKWSSILNKIDYEQERDRQRIYEANLRALTAGNTLGADSKDHRRSQANSSGNQRAGSTEQNDRKDHHTLYKGTPGKYPSDESQGQRTHQSDRRGNSGKEENSKGLDLAALLDGHPFGNLVEPSHQPDHLDNEVNQFKKKRKKRRRRGI